MKVPKYYTQKLRIAELIDGAPGRWTASYRNPLAPSIPGGRHRR